MPHAVLHLPNYSNFIRAGEFGVRIILLSMILGLCSAVLPASAQALIQINIPRQSLDTALKDLAQQTGLQIGRFSDVVDGSAMVGPVTGQLSAEQALQSLLVPSGLSYKMVNARTIAIVPLPAAAGGEDARRTDADGKGENVDADKKSAAQKFRLAQADEKNPGAASEKMTSVDQAAEPKLDEIIVTAQKRVENLQNVPISAQVISGKALSEQNFNSLENLTQTVPGVNVTTGGGSQGDTLVIRGVGYNSNAAVLEQSVATFEDDIYHGRSRMSYATFLDLDHIEVLKGPQSTFFGNNAIAGALNIVTKKPGDEFEGFARALYGMHGQYAVEGAATAPIDDKLSIRVAGIFSGTGGWIRNLNTNEDAPRQENKSGRLTAVFKPTGDLDAALKIEGGDDRTLGTGYGPTQLVNCPPPAPFTAATVGVGGVCAAALAQHLAIGLYNNENNGIPGQGTWLSTFEDVLTVNYHQWDHTFTSVTGYSSYHFSNKVDSNSAAIFSVTQYVPERSNQFSQEFRVASPAQQPIEYLAGVYFQTGRTGQSPTVNDPYLSPAASKIGIPAQVLPLSIYIPFSQVEQVYSVFGSLGWNVTDRLRLNAGVRQSWVQKSMVSSRDYGTSSAIFGGFTSIPPALENRWAFVLGAPGPENLALSEHALMPSAGIQYQITPEAMAYFSYSKGFLAGGFSYGSLAGNPFPEFGPEHVNAYELGLKSKWLDDRLLLNFDVFRANYQDLQVSEIFLNPIASTASQVTNNAAASRSQGVEFEGQWAISKDLRISADVTYLDSHYLSYPDAVGSSLQQFCTASYVLPYCSVYPKPVPAFANKAGQQTQYSPRLSGSVTASYRTMLPGDYQFTTAVIPYFTSRYNEQDPYIIGTAGYMRLDARFTLASPDDHWALDLIGKNLTDRVIVTFARIYYAAKEEPRNVALQVRYKW
jgi:iron complex outermembrane receptor protein